MNESVRDPSFDWVTARANCALTVAFEELTSSVQHDADIATRWLRSQGEERAIFVVERNNPEETAVFAQDLRRSTPHIVFRLDERAGTIVVTDDHGWDVVVVPTLNHAGYPVFTVEGRGNELAQWQLRRLALERLFFGR